MDDFGIGESGTPVSKINQAKAMAAPVINAISNWGKNAGSSLLDSAKNLGGKASTTAGAIASSFTNAKDMVGKQTSSGEKTLNPSAPWLISDYDKNLQELFPIGRPCKFNQNVDPYYRFSNYLRSKMSVIDLLPVDYNIDYAKMVNIAKSGTSKDEPINSVFSFGYNADKDSKIAVYKRLCTHHGLKEYVGLRLFTTDDTTTNETIQVNYKDSTFQGMADSLVDSTQGYRDLANSFLGSGSKQFNDKIKGAVTTATDKFADKFGASKGVKDSIRGVLEIAGDMVMDGNRMTFPKIWQNTTYNNNLSVNIRLVSPYGHPKAVKEFIMKPLSYLILLAAPQTQDGITYGGNIPITIKAYGLNYTTIGSISALTFRRGGADTSFNLYRQPLTVDVTIEFQHLFNAFAVFDSKRYPNLKTDKGLFSKKDATKDNLVNASSINLYDDTKGNLITSLGTILASLRPVRLIGMDPNISPQVYGLFESPNRSQIPDAPSFTPLTGNLGSAISGTVSSIGKFADMVTNAPKLIQQGLGNAVYNMAKGSVGSISGAASGWIGKAGSAADGVRNTILGNLM